MTEVPEIPLDQIQARVVAMWMGSFYGSSGYVARKLGKKGLREFQDKGARQVAATFKKLGLAEPKDVALAIATNDKNLFGSTVEVIEADGWVEIKTPPLRPARGRQVLRPRRRKPACQGTLQDLRGRTLETSILRPGIESGSGA